MFGTRKLGRTTDSRKAMLRSMTTDLLEYGKIKTTFFRAKELQPVAEGEAEVGYHLARRRSLLLDPRDVAVRRIVYMVVYLYQLFSERTARVGDTFDGAGIDDYHESVVILRVGRVFALVAEESDIIRIIGVVEEYPLLRIRQLQYPVKPESRPDGVAVRPCVTAYHYRIVFFYAGDYLPFYISTHLRSP